MHPELYGAGANKLRRRWNAFGAGDSGAPRDPEASRCRAPTPSVPLHAEGWTGKRLVRVPRFPPRNEDCSGSAISPIAPSSSPSCASPNASLALGAGVLKTFPVVRRSTVAYGWKRLARTRDAVALPPTPARSEGHAPKGRAKRSPAFAAPTRVSNGFCAKARLDVACPGCTSNAPTTAFLCDGGARLGSTKNTSFEMNFTASSIHIGSWAAMRVV
mmetsp:Transcript_7497/g.28164  ORF Transcript_7497/g.28164 Transcript_7497/m.28164 type:complete len:216 (-) Transcript_7497:125-772(-)